MVNYPDTSAPPEPPAPIPMILTCPACSARHIDEGEFATKPHHTHACQACGMVWRPALVPTVGVQFLPGFKNAPPDEALTRPWPSIPSELPCSCQADGAPAGRRCGGGWTRCNTRLAAIRRWQWDEEERAGIPHPPGAVAP